MKHPRAWQLIVALLVLFALATTRPASAATYLVRVPLKSRAILEKIQQSDIEILALNRDMVLDVLADDKELDLLRSLGVPLAYVTEELMSAGATQLDPDLGLYHTYAELEGELATLAATYPTLTDLSTIGTSIEGRNISVLKISDNAATDENEPEVLIMSNLHAREIMTVEITFKFAEYLLANYGGDAQVTDMVDEREIFIAPMLNPDGHVYVENNSGGNPNFWWRKNRRDNGDGSFGVDLNRNFGHQWGYNNIGSSPVTSSVLYRGTGPFSEPETQAIEGFCQSRNFTVGLSYHSYGELLLFPWGYVYGYTPDHDVFLRLGEILVASNGYFLGNPDMGAIYITNGGSDDWAYGETGTKPPFYMYTPEVNSSGQGGFAPSETLIQPTFDLLLPMNMTLLEYADNPRRAAGPYRPAMDPVTDNGYAGYTVSWSTDPMDPNPPVCFNVCEYKNMGTVELDSANAVTPLWNYDGFTVSTARAYEGSGSYYSGMDNASSKALEAAAVYPAGFSTDIFVSRVWYDIEQDWDYAYLEVSTDGGLSWVSVAGNLTTTTDPNGNNHGNGITGSSGGWVLATFNLSAWLGQDIDIRWRYVTDAAVLGEGIYVDLVGPVPTYEAKKTVTGVTETYLHVLPEEAGTYTYQVVAKDAEDDESVPSGSVTQDVPTVSAATEPLPAASELGACFPNPFNPATRIPYAVGDPSRGGGAPLQVTLEIFDVTGRRVETLVDDRLPPGRYQAVWTARDRTGRDAPSGVYFARLTVEKERIRTRKLVLLR